MRGFSCRRLVKDEDIGPCIGIRRAVFVVGQNVPEDLEIDGLDGEAWHYLGEQNGHAVATARVRFPEKDVAKIERVAVLDECRGQGIGHTLMLFILDDIKGAARKTKLSSQTHAVPFYERLGFKAYGDEFMDAGIPHYMMEMKI